jgi:predicted double-glycine peptidase
MKIGDIFSEHNVHIQKLSYSCGPCSILNILHLKGDFSETEESLTLLCGAVKGVGTSNDALVDSCRKVGLEVVGSRGDSSLEDLEKSIDNGYYVIVNYFDAFSGAGHYSIVNDYDEEAVYILDCSFGLFRLDKKDFLKHWHNKNKSVFRWYVSLR